MAKQYAAVFLMVVLVTGWIFAGLREKHPYRETSAAVPTAHAYDDAAAPIRDIRITAYYFVPANKAADAQDASWKEPLAAALEDLKRFHELQFAGTSHIAYTILPDAKIGARSNAYYDTDDTGHGNPHALESIAAELAADVAAKATTSDAYPVTYIIYDGVGASGMRQDAVHAALVNRRFLVDPAYEGARGSLVAHEFYHTLGVPDGYVLSSGTSTTADLMGFGRSARPLKDNFLGRETLTHLGL